MTTANYCNKCGAKLTVTNYKTGFYNVEDGKPKIKQKKECPTGICGHYGIEHVYEDISKNFLDLCGKPLYQWSLEQTQEASKQYPVSKIIVSTDALEEVLLSSFKHTYANNVELVKLPEWLAQEPYQLASVTLFVINDLFNRDDKVDFDCLVMVQVTNPLILAEDIINCIELYRDNKKSIRSFTDVDRIWTMGETINGFNCYTSINNRSFNFSKQSCVGVIVEDINNFRNQTIDEVDFDFYPISYTLPKERAVDIDDEMDFEYAKILLKRREK